MADADRIQDYVFGTQELRLICGASSIQIRCTTELAAITRRMGAKVLRHDGGTVVALLPEGCVGQFKSAANDIYRRLTHSATVTVATVRHGSRGFKRSYKELQSLSQHLTLRPVVHIRMYSVTIRLFSHYPMLLKIPVLGHTKGRQQIYWPTKHQAPF